MEGRIMKNTFVLICMAFLALTACNQDLISTDPDEGTKPAITFNLSATHPDDVATKAVKTGWETGDVVFVFFSTAAAPQYLEMKWNGTEWVNTEKNGLSLADGATGTMRAIFLPFGSNATVSSAGGSFIFSETYYSYYLTATLEYSVTGGHVSGTFEMQIPSDYVQFYIEDAAAVDGSYTLGIDAVIPVGVASIGPDCLITETSDREAKDDLPGYAYGGGLLFSGKFVSNYNDTYNTTFVIDGDAITGPSYYFAKTKEDDGSRADYFVTGKTLTSHKAYKLPSNGDSKWQAVGADITMSLSKGETSLGTWHTCNYECSLPEQPGSVGVNSAFPSYGNTPEQHLLPPFLVFEKMVNNCPRTWISIHGHHGFVFKADNGFLFFPAGAPDDNQINYWTSTWWSGSVYRTIHFNKDGYYEFYRGSAERYARYIVQ